MRALAHRRVSKNPKPKLTAGGSQDSGIEPNKQRRRLPAHGPRNPHPPQDQAPYNDPAVRGTTPKTPKSKIHETDEHLYFVMEYINGGELYDYIVENGRLAEEEACHFYYQLLLAIQHLNSQGISHRDIKPENILLDSNNNV